MIKEIRYFQQEAKDAVFKALERCVNRLLVVMPGGTGKTVTAAHIIKEFGRKLWITHEESLAEQSAVSLLNEFGIIDSVSAMTIIERHGGLVKLLERHQAKRIHDKEALLICDNIGLIKADMFDIDKPIVVASAQTLWMRLDKFKPDYFEVIVADEGDLFGSKSFKAPLDYFTPKLLLSLTATPYRMDGMLMEDIFQEIVYEYPIQQAIKDGYLTELNGIVVKTSTNLDDVGTTKGDFNQKQLTQKVNTPQRNNLIVNKYLEYCEGQQFICFGADIQHVIDLHEAFMLKGVNTAYVVSDKERMMVGIDRKEIVAQYRKGEIVGLINYNIFSAGFDAPDTGCVILACPTKSKRKFLQQLFRVTRLKSKSFVDRFGQIGTILDIVDGTSKHSIVNTRTLDEGLEIEDRVFVSRKNKDLLLQARKDKEFTSNLINTDKKVELIPIPKISINFNTENMKKPASLAQLQWIERLGYNITEEYYTMGMIQQILGKENLSRTRVTELKEMGYDTTKRLTNADYNAVQREIWIKKQKKLKK